MLLKQIEALNRELLKDLEKYISKETIEKLTKEMEERLQNARDSYGRKKQSDSVL